MSSAPDADLEVNDPVAIAVESHVRNMDADGYGTFSIRKDDERVVIGFGSVEVHGENSDVALIRLARALLDHADLAATFLQRMRDPALNPPEMRLGE